MLASCVVEIDRRFNGSLVGFRADEKADGLIFLQRCHEYKTICGCADCACAIALVAWFAWRSLRDPESDQLSVIEDSPVNTVGPITLSDHKRKVAGIQTEPVRLGDLQLTRTLPARFAYNDKRHVALRAPTDGVLQSVLVQPGDAVTAGQPVAVLRSPAIGVARSAVLTQESNVELADKVYRRQAGLYENVTELARRIRGGASVDSIQRDVDGKSLGDYGSSLLTAYSQSLLARNLSQSIQSVGDSGAISGRVMRERETQREQAEASLDSTIDQSLFQTEQASAKAKADLEQAERELRIAQQTLGTLIAALPRASDGLDVSPNEPDVSKLTVTSPIAGTIESKTFSATERVSAGDEIVVIADTSYLWVEADIRSRDWNSIHVTAGDQVSVTTPSVNLLAQPATVLYLGRQVDPSSGAIPLVASIENKGGHFRPGLFAHMRVPTQTLSQVISVPESAVLDLGGQDSVFVEREAGFVSIAVDVGSRSEGRIEIRGGLSVGDSVVVAGAFTLKSELLLEGEE